MTETEEWLRERIRYSDEHEIVEVLVKDLASIAEEIERLRNLYKETCEEKNKEIFEWIEHSKQLVLNSLPWQEENARLREMVKYFACHCGGTCDRSDENCLISQAALGEKE